MRGIWARTRAKPSHHQLAPRRASANSSRSTSPSKPDQGVGGEHEQRQVEDRAPRDAAQPDQVLFADVERRAHPLAHVVELDVDVLEGVLQPRRHRRLLQERQDGDEVLVAEHAAGGRRRRLLAGQAAGPGRSAALDPWTWRAASSATEADERSPNPSEPSGWMTMRSRSSRRWTMPASWSRPRSSHSGSMSTSNGCAVACEDGRRAARPPGGRRPRRHPARRCRP